MKQFLKNNPLIAALLILNLALYVLFVTMDLRGLAGAGAGFSGGNSVLIVAAPGLSNITLTFSAPALLKYAGITSCLLIALRVRRDPWRGRDGDLQAAVLAITLAPDFLLLFTDFFAAGVIAFFAAHLTALRRYRPRWFPAGMAIAICAVVVYALLNLAPLVPKAAAASEAAQPLRGVSPLLILVTVYALLITAVTVTAFRAPQPRPNRLLSSLGMCLFLGCDVHVALFNGLPAAAPYHAVAGAVIWIFYLPAQTLLALSAKRWASNNNGSA